MSMRWGSIAETITQAGWFQKTVIGVILAAGILVGLETVPQVTASYGGLLDLADRLVLAFFVVEILLKLIAQGGRPWLFFRDPWNAFDFAIVVACFIPATGPFAPVLRLVRLLRVLRLVSAVPQLRLIVNALLRSLPSMGYVGLLLLLLFYMYGVLGVFLFSENDPVHFGNLKDALISLFRVVTLEDWTDILYIQMHGADVYPIAHYDGEIPNPGTFPVIGPLYFVSFVLIGTMIMLNLFVGVIVNSIHEIQREKELAERKAREQHQGDLTLAEEVAILEDELIESQKRLHRLRRALEQEAPSTVGESSRR